MIVAGGVILFSSYNHDELPGSTEVSIAHIGKVVGSEEIATKIFGYALIVLGSTFLYKFYVGRTWVEMIKQNMKQTSELSQRMGHSITSTGKEIARRMRQKDMP